MQPETPLDITGLLHRWSQGDAAALEKLTPLVYGELRAIARHHLAGQWREQTLSATALIHETWLRLVKVKVAGWEDRAHFYALCAQLMRRILVDHARARLRARRGGGWQRTSLDEELLVSEEQGPLVALDDALNALSELDPRRGRVVELRFFGGLSVQDTASVLKISPDSVKRDWRLAKAWLMRELSAAGAP